MGDPLPEVTEAVTPKLAKQRARTGDITRSARGCRVSGIRQCATEGGARRGRGAQPPTVTMGSAPAGADPIVLPLGQIFLTTLIAEIAPFVYLPLSVVTWMKRTDVVALTTKL